MILKKGFYQKHTLDVAQALLGCFLMRKSGRKIIRARIVRPEAYHGEDDLACHASRGKTKRTEVMYGEAGYAYVYMIYGMYHCLNIVTGPKDFPAAVLIRVVEIEGVPQKQINGPGKLCRFLEIDRVLNGCDMTDGKKLWIESGKPFNHETIVAKKRIGIDYAKHCKDYLWRFVLKSNN